ncbi:hypothetical protein ACKGJO_11885 [Gracilimonas sp. Q87]|uniref:hypothetical protein n=1 Tax=Gracilimonas sp. Q87 TaxID=3384766 RepID=UPI0039845EAB
MNRRKQFRAPWDLKLIVITSVVIIVFGGLDYTTPNLWPSILLWGTVLGSATFGYTVTTYKMEN